PGAQREGGRIHPEPGQRGLPQRLWRLRFRGAAGMTEHSDQAQGVGGRDPLVELLSQAGARPAIDAGVRQLAERAAHEVWMRQLRRQRQRRWMLSLAAAGAFAAVLAGWIWRLQPEPAAPLALRIERIEGRVSRLVDGQRLALDSARPLHRGDRL